MNDFLYNRRKELGYTLEEVGNMVGVGKSTVRKWENGMIENMGRDKIVALSKALNISPIDILELDESDLKNDISTIYNQLNEKRQNKVYIFAANQLEEQNKKVAFKVYGDVAAGPALEYNDAEVETHYAESVPVSADMALTINGDSMEPEFPNGSIVFYKRQQQVEHGEIAIVEIDGNSVTCKKVCYDYDNKKVVLQSLNDKYEDMEYEADHIRILGKVVK